MYEFIYIYMLHYKLNCRFIDMYAYLCPGIAKMLELFNKH